MRKIGRHRYQIVKVGVTMRDTIVRLNLVTLMAMNAKILSLDQPAGCEFYCRQVMNFIQICHGVILNKDASLLIVKVGCQQ